MSNKKEVIATMGVQEEEENTDSGFLSGPLEDFVEYDSKHGAEPEFDPIQLDSGVDLKPDSGNLYDPTSSPTATSAAPKASEYPPLAILFEGDEDGDT